MCTVSYIYADDSIILTSNRDEQVIRPALPPQHYLLNGKEVIYPKDPRAGGTWIVSDSNANAAVLLNGAAEKHQMGGQYRISRGLILLDLIGADSPVSKWESLDLVGVEPFTIILLQRNELYQLRWSGLNKEKVILDPQSNYIWSSVTLYSAEARFARELRFQSLVESKKVGPHDMMEFHNDADDAELHPKLIIDRNGILKTLSITQLVIGDSILQMTHRDLLTGLESTESFQTNATN